MILHDWPAQEALIILQNHLAVLKHDPKARMIIMDTVLPSLSPGQQEDHIRGHDQAEALLRVRDLTMMQCFNAKERELSEFIDLLTKTSDGEGQLVLRNVFKPPGSVLSILEVVYERFDSQINALVAPQPNRVASYQFDAQLGGLILSNGSSHGSLSQSHSSSEHGSIHNFNGNDINLSATENTSAMSTSSGPH